MRKIISMLLAISMSLSVMCSSFTVTAVDRNNTAAQAESTGQSSGTGFDGLFADELNEKFAEKSNECGINSVEVSGNIATVSYRASKDCTIIVGIYEDDDTDGTHMLTFGTANVKADETTAAVTIDNLPQYFYLKAYLVDSVTYRPLAAEYSNSNYTEAVKEFEELTVDDFDSDRVWNFDDDPKNNFMILAKKTRVINTDHDISTDDIEYSSDRLVVHKADTDEKISGLKKDDSFIIFHDDGMFYGVVSKVTISDGGQTASIEYGPAVMSDLFEVVKINTALLNSSEPVAVDETEEYSIALYNARSKDDEPVKQSGKIGFTIDATDIASDIKKYNEKTDDPKKDSDFDPNKKDNSNNKNPFKGEKEVKVKISVYMDIDLTLYYQNKALTKDLKMVQLDFQPTFEISVSGSAELTICKDLAKKMEDLLSVKFPLLNIGGINVISFVIGAKVDPITITVEAAGTLKAYDKFTVKSEGEKDNVTKTSSSTGPKVDMEFGGEFSVEFSIGVEVTFLILDTGVKDKDGEEISFAEIGADFQLKPSFSLEKSISNEDQSTINGSQKEVHGCKEFECFDGECSVNCSITGHFKLPWLELFHIENTVKWTFVDIELLPKKYQKIFLSKENKFVPKFGECDNKYYLANLHVEDEISKTGISDIEIKTNENMIPRNETIKTNIGGSVYAYVKPNTNVNITLTDPTDAYEEKNTTINVSMPYDASNYIGTRTLISMKPKKAEIVSITPLAGGKAESGTLKYTINEALRYDELRVKYKIVGRDTIHTLDIPLLNEYVTAFNTDTAGTYTLVIEYHEAKWEQEYEVIERQIDSISINTLPDKTEYAIGEVLDITGLTIDVKYTDGTSDTDVTVSSSMISGFDTSTEGEKEITVTFTDANGNSAETYFTIIVIEDKREVESIKIKTLPDKTEYAIGEALDITGLTIDVNFTDGTSDTDVAVSPDKVTGFESEIAGIKTLTVTYTDKYGNEATASFDVEVVSDGDVKSIEIQQLLTQNKYCEINKELNIDGVTIKVTYKDGTTEILPITSDMVEDFDISTLGTFPVTVTYEQCRTTYDVEVVENLKKVCRIELFNESPYYSYRSHNNNNIWQGNFLSSSSSSYYSIYTLVEYFLDGTKYVHSEICTFIRPDGSITGYYEGRTILRDGKYGGKIKIEDFDINKTGVQKVTATYCLDDGTLDPDVEPVSVWIGVHTGKSDNDWNHTEPVSPGDVGYVYGQMCYDPTLPNGYVEYRVGEKFKPELYYINYRVYSYDSNEKNWKFISPDTWERDSEGKVIKLPNGSWKVNSSLLLSNPGYHYLGGFDSRYPSGYISRAYFEYSGFVFTVLYKVVESDTVSAISEYDYGFDENMQYDDYSGYDDMEYDTPAVTEATEETETTDNTESTDTKDENTDETDSTEPTETEVTEPVDTETTDTEQQPEETTVTETAEVEEAPVFAIDNNGIFGFGRASAKKSAQFANLHKNDIYNCYVVKSGSADILGKDNLLFVGQTSSDGNGSLSFEYETTTGEDGTIILRPMFDDPTNPDTPNQPTVPDNSGNSSNTNTNTGTVIPVGGTNTVSLTVTVENKVTGKTSKAKGQKTGSSATIKLGTENDGYFANVYTTDGEYICSALIENGRAKFTVPDDVKLKITIDSIAYGEDVSSEAGASENGEPVNIPYPMIVVLIAAFGIYFKVGKKYKVKQ